MIKFGEIKLLPKAIITSIQEMFVILIGIFIPIFDFDQSQLAFKLGLETTKKMNEICLKLIL